MSKLKLSSVLLLLIITVDFTTTSKILFLLPIATKSHKNVFDPLIEAMASRNHEVTVISPLRTSSHKSVKEIVPLPLDKVMVTMTDPFDLRRQGSLSIVSTLNLTHMGVVCGIMYENSDVKELMKTTKFDLIIMNGVVNLCALGLVHYFKAPHILLTTMPAPGSIAEKLGNRFPPSFVPEPILPLSDKMNFMERVSNFVIGIVIWGVGIHYFEPTMEKVYQKYIPDAPEMAKIDEGISMLFMNSHFTLTYPRPLLPNVIEVGGMHCRKGEPLPKDLDEFLSGAKDGFILFSLGSIVKPQNMPEQAKKVFLNVFSKLKQRVIWKWDGDEMAGLPKNVKLSKWLPQQDILAHPNIRLFMTHGGLLSTQEAAYHGVPLVGIPIFADQDLNMKQAEKVGNCLTVEILDMTEEKLESVLNKILNEPHFAQKAKDISRIYRDQPQTSLERAVFWAEYVIRHKGARHMSSSAKELNLIQYHSLDVIALILTTIFVGLYLLKYLLWNVFILKLILRRSSSKSVKGKTDSRKKRQ